MLLISQPVKAKTANTVSASVLSSLHVVPA